MGEITLLGTSHIAQESIRRIRAAAETSPAVIAVELDHKRLASLLQGGKTALRFSDIRRIGLKGFLFAWIAGIVQRKLGAQVGIIPGSDMLQAVKIAHQQKIPIALIDQDIEITLRRFSSRLSWRERGRFLIDIIRGLLFGKRELKKYGLAHFDLRKVPSEEMIATMVKLLRERYPNVYEVLVEDRNRVMAQNLLRLAAQHEGTILAVVGAGHVMGMREILRQSRANS